MNPQPTPVSDLRLFFTSATGERRAALLSDWPVLMVGLDASGKVVPLRLGDDGSPVSTAPAGADLNDGSGSITAGGTAQDALAINAARRYFFFQNISDTDMWLNYGVDAVADEPSILVKAGGNYENPPHFCPQGRISVMCAATGKKFVCKEA